MTTFDRIGSPALRVAAEDLFQDFSETELIQFWQLSRKLPSYCRDDALFNPIVYLDPIREHYFPDQAP